MSPDRAAVAVALARVRSRIESAGGRLAKVTVVAVTKGQPAEVCRLALELGLRDLGENRVQEAVTKMDAVEGARWHLVGHLQSNKARPAAGRFALVQSIDSERVAEALARHGRQAVLVEVNVAREPGKQGVAPELALELATQVAGMHDLRGFMAMGSREGDPGPAFRELGRIRDEGEQRLGRALPVLSMGMSDDFETAVAAGSTMVRLGRALFGASTL